MNSDAKPDAVLTRILSEVLESRGILSFGFLDGSGLAGPLQRVAADIRESYGLDSARGALVAALHYDTTGEPAGSMDEDYFRSGEGGFLAALGWFARAHWYRELEEILASAVRAPGLSEAGPRRAYRRAVNSRLPEKALAVAAGLGPVGKNTLVLERRLGPGCVLGILILPFEPDLSQGTAWRDPGIPASGEPGSECGDCDECVRACPTGAVRGEGGIDRGRCLQHWAGAEGPVPADIAAAWRGGLYGCDLCLAACPLFRPGVEREASTGRLGRGLSPAGLLRAGDAELRERFRGTALGLSWLSPAILRRNARLAEESWNRKQRPGPV